MNRSRDIEGQITLKVTEGLASLEPHLQSWVRAHLIQPRQIQLSTNPNGNSFKNFWLITDHVGTEDSSYRIVYDEDEQAFGLESTLDGGVEWYMGITARFLRQLKTCSALLSRALSAHNNSFDRSAS